MAGRASPPSDALFISWIRFHGRSATLAAAVGAECAFIAAGNVGNRRTAPFRYLVQAARTVLLLSTRRPRALIVMAPPDLLVAIASVYSRLRRARLVIDAHTGAVTDARGNIRRRFAGLASGATLTLVTNAPLQEMLRQNGVARTMIVHDPPLEVPDERVSAEPPRARFTVIVPASWYQDEPWPIVLATARLVPEIDFVFTGRPPRRVVLDARNWPSNARLSGHLPSADYHKLVASADAVVALTTREHTMQRAAYEAMAHERPLIASDTEVLRDYFTAGAVFAGSSPAELAAALDEARSRAAELAVAMAGLRRKKLSEFERTRTALRRVVESR